MEIKVVLDTLKTVFSLQQRQAINKIVDYKQQEQDTVNPSGVARAKEWVRYWEGYQDALCFCMEMVSKTAEENGKGSR